MVKKRLNTQTADGPICHEDPHAISDLAARLSLEYDMLLGPRAIGRERWERMQEHRSGLYRNVVTEGIPLLLAETATP